MPASPFNPLSTEFGSKGLSTGEQEDALKELIERIQALKEAEKKADLAPNVEKKNTK